MKITPKRRPQWTEEELDAIFNKGKPSSIFLSQNIELTIMVIL